MADVQYSEGGTMYLKLDIILVKKNHVIRVVFHDQAMYALSWFDFAKIGKSINRRIKSIETD